MPKEKRSCHRTASNGNSSSCDYTGFAVGLSLINSRECIDGCLNVFFDLLGNAFQLGNDIGASRVQKVHRFVERVAPVEEVKKKLNILKDKNIVRVKGINPKYWKFDEYNFQRLDDDDDIFHLLCNFEDVDFDKYFSY